ASEARPRPALAGDEEELVRGLRDGKAWAERLLLERYGAHVERVLTHILGSHTDLDDLAQEVFVRALGRVNDLREAGALRDWLSGFAANVAREAIRRKRRRWWQVRAILRGRRRRRHLRRLLGRREDLPPPAPPEE